MELKIRNVIINYDGEGSVENVSVGFNSFQNDTSISGNVNLTYAEYTANSTDLTTLSTLVTNKIKANVNE